MICDLLYVSYNTLFSEEYVTTYSLHVETFNEVLSYFVICRE